MGYRHFFYEVSKSEIEKVRSLTREELLSYMRTNKPGAVDDEDYFSFHDVADQKKIFEFGKLYYEDTAEQIYSTGNPLFLNAETQKKYDDYVPYICGKEALLKAIAIYKKKVLDYYKSLFEDGETLIAPLGIEVPREKPKAEKQEQHIKDMLSEWEHDWAVNTDETKEAITTSWKYEYQIFELVRLLKTTNWEEKSLLFYGW